MNKVQELIHLQSTYYEPIAGINAIPLLGLIGESGEVADEVTLSVNLSGLDNGDSAMISSFYTECSFTIDAFIQEAKKLDALKKRLVNDPTFYSRVGFTVKGDNFDKELADQFFYLLRVAAERGLSLDDLAGLCLEKIVLREERNQ